MENKGKVFVAMSGGIDSSVAALLLKRQGYQVTGVFMKYWADSKGVASGAENRCCSLEARQDAARVCAKLKIPFLTWDFSKEFKKVVVNDFICGYKKGITPNPCVICNREIKLGLFLKKAMESEADYIATGHYVKLATGDKKQEMSHVAYRISLFAAKDKNKDQSYFLWTLMQNQLKHCLFPIGDYLKPEVRQIAKRAGLPVALKKESQEVCFVKDANLREFLKSRIHTNKGDIIELKTGKKIGEHSGIQFYTIGQRVPIGGTGPYYVFDKNLKKNQLLVVGKNDKKFLRKEIELKNVNWISGQSPKSNKVFVRVRYRQPLVEASIMRHATCCILHFDNPLGFAAPGQSAVFYSKRGELLGGGIILY